MIAGRRPVKIRRIMRSFELFHVQLLPFKGENMVNINCGVDCWPTAGIGSRFRNFIKKITNFFYRLLFAREIEITGQDLDGRGNFLKIRSRIADTQIQQVAIRRQLVLPD